MGKFAGNVGDTLGARFAAAVAADPARPLLTWYDDATGDRAELSGATLANWVAKTANLLVDGCGLGPGSRAAVLLPPHWQTAAVLLGCWSAAVACTDSWSVDRTGGPGATAGEPVDVLFTSTDRTTGAPATAAGERYALGLAPLAAPLRTVPPGYADYVVEVRAHGDHFTPHPAVRPDEVALLGAVPENHHQLCLRADQRASALGIAAEDRVLIDAAIHPDPVDWLLAPVLAGASVVLCGQLDPDRLRSRTAAERVTVTLAGGDSVTGS